MAPSGPGGARPTYAGWVALGLSSCSVGLVALALVLRHATGLPAAVAGVVLAGAGACFLAGLLVWRRWRRRRAAGSD